MKKLLLLGIVIICIWLVYEYPHAMINPGELTEGHQDVSKNCLSCHKPFWGIESKKCETCHKLSEIGKDTLSLASNHSGKEKVLFHQHLSDHKCTACHTDHEGIMSDVSLKNFDHDFLTQAMLNQCATCHSKPPDNLHNQLSSSCSKCHNTNGWQSSVLFNHDMIESADKNNCISCHRQPDDSFHNMIKDNCNKCHSPNKWVPSTFDHSSYFMLDKDHNVKCITCHENSNFKSYTCYGCHEHTPTNIMEEHREEGINNLNDCVSCHKSSDEHGINKNEESGRELDKEKKHSIKEKHGKQKEDREEGDDDD